MKIGKPKYGNDFVPTKYWKLKDGESTYRILPPLGDLADNGTWSMFYRVHYGYRNTTNRMRVFQSSLVVNRESKMIEVPDAAIERIEKLKSELEKAKASKNHMLVEKFKGLLQNYNLDSNHYVNAMDTQGNIGILKLRHRAKQALDATIKKLSKTGVDPLSPEDGRFLTFTRTGTGLDTSFQVNVTQEEVDVPSMGKMKRDLPHTLTAEIIGRLGTEARDLSKLFKKLTAKEIESIVKESDLESGRSPAIDVIFDTKGDSTDDAGDDDSGDTSSGGGGSSGHTSSEGASFSGPSVETGFSLIGGEGTTTTPFSNSVDPVPLPVIEQSSTTQTTAQKVNGMSEEDFQKYLSSLGI